jgi:flagellar hook-length control protein FliK
MGISDMTMMTSLKAFLFPAATTPVGAGGAASVPTTGTSDFAQLLGGLDAQASAAASATPIVAASSSLAVPSVPSDVAEGPAALAINPAVVPAEPAAMSPQFVAAASTPAALPTIAGAVSLPPAVSAEGASETVAPAPAPTAEVSIPWHIARTSQRAPAALPATDALPETATPADAVLPEQVETVKAPAQEMAQVVMPPVALPKSPLAGPAPVGTEQGGDSVKPAAMTAAKPVTTPIPASTAETVDPIVAEGGDDEAPESDENDVAAAQLPTSDALPLPIAQIVTQPSLPVAEAAPLAAPVDMVAPATLAPASAPADPLPLRAATLVADSAAPGVEATPASAVAKGVETPLPLDQVEAVAPAAQAASAPAPAPIRAEVVSLLQFARDHMTGRIGHRVEEPAVRAISADAAATPDAAAPLPAFDLPTPSPTPAASTATPTSPTSTTSIAPTVDLSASIGAQVVDMGVSGQWIDGLARDIAGLSANGAQGRFQIDAQQLGPVQVDIRQGADGASVSLTVATQQAEEALRQDSDRLKTDAAFSAVRIADVRIERAVPTGDTVRADTQSQQQNQGSSQQHQQQNAASWNAMGQNAGQSASGQGQGRWQSRENFALGHKAGSDGAVLNHDQSGESAARYA